MRYCPHCRSEYQDWVLKCIDCGAKLVDHLPEESEGIPGFVADSNFIFSGTVLIGCDQAFAKYSRPSPSSGGLSRKCPDPGRGHERLLSKCLE
jgi:hypothetical protein